MNLTRPQKTLLSVGAVGAAASIAGLGTFATFTDTDTGAQNISAGTVNINLGAAGADNRLTVEATGLVPGDTIQRRVKLTNAGSQNLASITLTTAATTSSLLDTDTTNGLQLKIEKCAGALGWRETGTGPYTYTCDQTTAGDNAGTRTSVLARRPVIGSALALANMSSLTAGQTDDIVVTSDLPSTAPNTMQGLTSVIQHTFNATQRGATDR
ncbi:MAG: hypothetical protein M3N68_01315 [Actinomycetota bacterium]|nr:hypothetical protein [Actinomycetota bacterium]